TPQHQNLPPVPTRRSSDLTKTQMNENRKMSRPATDFTPSAKEQNAGIRNQTFFGGIAHEFKINNHLTHNISIFGMYTDFENPFRSEEHTSELQSRENLVCR